MISCHHSNSATNFAMLGQTTSTLRLFHRNFRYSRPISAKFRCLIHQIAPNFVVFSSLGPLFASAAAVAPSSHAAVTSTITQVAVTAVAIASGACLSTRVDFLWPKSEEQPSPLILDGVDVTGYTIFNDPKAVSFARKAHHGQLRKTGEPYLTHCLHTGRILAVLVPPSGQRAVDTVVAGILHDVVDDTSESLLSVREFFGDDVAQMVAGVSRLSYINQLLRRHRRTSANQSSLSHEEANDLRVMLLGMVDDPRVVLIKLADRLHNMRTMYRLSLCSGVSVAIYSIGIIEFVAKIATKLSKIQKCHSLNFTPKTATKLTFLLKNATVELYYYPHVPPNYSKILKKATVILFYKWHF